LAIITDIPFVEFQDRNPNKEELEALRLDIKRDLYAPLLNSVDWNRGKSE